ncbi:Hint domain-containing protein [Acetobacter pasteurianus]|uniref:Outer membrane protein n=1 Tax=Acetobacter pasteurianus NBRC 3188 TaxID=1226663 RepID=A0A401WTF3_ACEPA|nr:Hint domain-containing protein [Acetobacter pasteurianus]GCD52524.1 outer membrane protein [Acetobacter pasteurianus NBRC 3188]
MSDISQDTTIGGGSGNATELNGGTVLSGVGLFVSSGGIASNVTVGSGGYIDVYNSGTAISALVSGASAVLNVSNGGKTSNTSVTDGGNIIVSAGGSSDNDLIKANGQEAVWGTANNLIISGNNTHAYLHDGGTGTNWTTEDGGWVGIYSGASLDGFTVTGQNTYGDISGGQVTNASVTDGGTLQIESGVAISGINATSGGQVYVSNGGSTTGTILSDSGTAETVQGGGSASGTQVASGASLTVSTDGSATDTTVSANGHLLVSGGTIVDTTITNGGEATLYDAATADTVTVDSGGSITFENNGTLTGTVTLQDGGSATIQAGTGGTIDVAGSSNTGVVISGLTSGGTVTTVISGFNGTSAGASDGIQLAGLKAADVTSVTYPSADQVNLLLTNGKTVTLSIAGAEKAGYTLVSDANGDLIYEVCFLSGSMIRTPDGDVAVEDIQIGDQVVTFDWKSNKTVCRPVIWVGKTHATVRPDLPHDEAGYPVRVRKDAIANGVPYKDMLITAEHCLFFEGKFVPVRMLVNGVSIFYDTSITSYDYYHVETEQHSVITADGMLTESYLDTGNRRAFRQEGKIAALRCTTQSWADHSAAPLCVERAFVEPLFRKLNARNSNSIGAEHAKLVTDVDLHLITESGAPIRPFRQDGQHYSFMLPANTAYVHIVSRASRPADVIGPFVDDRRFMGVAVADVHLLCAQQLYDITSHLQVEKPEGWHDTDWADCAWTNGNAMLPLGGYTKGKMGLLSMTIRAAGPYTVQNHKTAEAKLRSA